MSEEAALRLYPTAAQEFKEMLEENFGKEFFVPKKITDKIQNYEDICDALGVDCDDDSLVVKVPGFGKEEIKVIKAFIKKMRIAKVYNEGWLPKIGENRYYPVVVFSAGSGFVFVNARYNSSIALAASASRLCFKNAEFAKDACEKFIDIENELIDLK